MLKVFVYGTLMKGMSRAHKLVNSDCMGMAIMTVELFDLGSFPALLPGDGTVFGELYEVTEEALQSLGWVESYDENAPDDSLYLRLPATVII